MTDRELIERVKVLETELLDLVYSPSVSMPTCRRKRINQLLGIGVKSPPTNLSPHSTEE